LRKRGFGWFCTRLLLCNFRSFHELAFSSWCLER
jgi:hypothetical protein